MKLTIRQKLIYGFSSSFLFTLLAGLLLYMSLVQFETSFTNYAEVNERKITLAHEIEYHDLTLTDAVRGMLISPNNLTEVKRYEESQNKLSALLQEITPLLSTADEKEVLSNVSQERKQLSGLETKIIELAVDEPKLAMVLFEGEYSFTRKVLHDEVQSFTSIQKEQNAKALADTHELVLTRITITAGFVLFALLAGIVLTFFITRSILRPLQNVVEKMRELSGNAGDLTVRFENTGRDELGQLSSAFNSMLDTMQHLIRQTVLTAEQVAAASEQLSASAVETSEASEHIAVTVQEVAEGSHLQVKSIQDSSQIIEELSVGAQQIASHATDVAQTATQASKLAEDGTKSIQTAIHQMSSINSTIGVLAEEVKNLGGSSQQIGEIVEVISAIADQTNLLALNAAIEAARAGEHGRGFAVVAGEVRKLAEGTTQSAKQISELAAKIQADSYKTLRTMETSSFEVAAGIAQVNQAGVSFEEIFGAVQACASQIQEVSAAVEQMSTGTETVVQSIEKISTVTQASSLAAYNVSAGAEQQLASMEEIRASAEHLTHMAEELQVLVGKFKI